MKNKKQYRPGIVSLLLILMAALAGSAADKTDFEPGTLDCAQCHFCEEPTGEIPCVKACPSFTMTRVTSDHLLSEAPDSMVIGYLSDLYGPVHFDHKGHADMAEMGLKCAICHHYSPAGRIPSCRECHGGEADPNNLRQPALKGACHRQCLSCHREWSHATKCVVCHLPADERMASTMPDTTDIMGISHPLIVVPEKRIFNTGYSEGPVATFHHNDHVDLYGLSCASCHKEESCNSCHNMDESLAETVHTDNKLNSMEEVHSICYDCHGDDTCDKCHDDREKPAFSHNQTGFDLGPHHGQLECRACHPTGKVIGKLNRRCVNCHRNWEPDTFNHSVTGFRLDENHIEIECEMCHVESRFERKPTCTECHDEERNALEEPPGKYIR